ncbi:MAG: hypothetical protein Q9159_006133 [Coniocarpon cinnabarinum]
MSFQIGDAIALAKVAADLYQHVYLVAKKAPDTYESLLIDLVTVKNVLVKVHNQARQAGEESYDRTVQDAIFACERSLEKFKPLVIKYKKLALGNGSAYRQRLKLPFDIPNIASAQDQLQRSINTLQFALQVNQDVSAPRAVPLRAAQPDRQPHIHDQSQDDSDNDDYQGPQRRLLDRAATRQPSVPTFLRQRDRVQTMDSLVPAQLQTHRRVDTLASLPRESPRPTQLAPEVSQYPFQYSPDSSSRSNRSRSSIESQPSHAGPTPLTHVPSSPSTRERYFSESYSSGLSRNAAAGSDRQSVHSNQSRNSLSVREQQPRIPINTDYKADITRYLQQDRTFALLEPKLRTQADVFEQQRQPELEQWLERATWWLIKARQIASALRSGDVPPTRTADWLQRSPFHQAALDVYKACYICKHVLFANSNEPKPVVQKTWKIARELSRAVADELHHRHVVDALNPDTDLHALNIQFSEETHQAIEHPQTVPDALDSLEGASRWLTVDVDSAGGENEKVILRTFVNAEIGSPDMRGKSRSAPYLLIMWSQHARSEILVSLLNQMGTVHLFSTLTQEDIESAFELSNFLEQPKSFFKQIKEREPKPEEFLTFRDGLHSFVEHAHRGRASIGGPETVQSHKSCEVSLYQLIPDLYWKTRRRLVISSAFDATQPWCYSFWLPLAQVQVLGDGTDVELHWSDCNQFRKIPDGNYGFNHSYVYDSRQPNINVILQFQTARAADDFKAAILRPWVIPFEDKGLDLQGVFSSSGGRADLPNAPPVGQELSIWRLMDANRASTYSSILYTSRLPQSGFVSNVFFMGSDVDFLIEYDVRDSVSFHGLWLPEYISNVVNSKSPPEVPGFCEDVDWTSASARFDFEPKEMSRFMSTLIGYDLIWSSRAHSIATSTKVGATRYKDVIVSLWKRPSGVARRELRVTVRWLAATGKKEPIWTTTLISTGNGSSCSINSSKVTLNKIQIDRGSQLDTRQLAAVDDSGKPEQYKKPLVIFMQDQRMARQLASVINAVLDMDPVVDPSFGMWHSPSNSTPMATSTPSAMTPSVEYHSILDGYHDERNASPRRRSEKESFSRMQRRRT